MSAPYEPPIQPGATTVPLPGAPAPPLGTPMPTPGTWTIDQNRVIGADPEMALRQFLSGKGLDFGQASRSLFGKFMMKNFMGLWDAYLASQGMGGSNDPTGAAGGDSNVLGNMQNILGQFSNAYSGGAGDFTGMMNNAIGGAMRNANLNMMDEPAANKWLIKLLSAQQSFMNPMMGQVMGNQFDDLLGQRRQAEWASPTGTTVSGTKFGDFLNSQPYWQQILASMGR